MNESKQVRAEYVKLGFQHALDMVAITKRTVEIIFRRGFAMVYKKIIFEIKS